MKRLLYLLAFLPLCLASCENKEDIPKEGYIEEARMDGRAYDALKRAGIVIGDYQNVFGLGVGETEIDSNGNGIHYYQVSATKGSTAYIYLMSYIVEGQGNKYAEFDYDAITKFNIIKSYSFPITQTEQVVDHGYGNKETLVFCMVHMSNILHAGSNYYASLIDVYGNDELLRATKTQFDNPRFLMDISGSVKTIPYSFIKENIPNDSYRYDDGLWLGYNGSVVCGPYCYSKTGEVLFQTSAWSDLYNASILNAKLGTWYFPISDNEIFIIAFESHMETKADPTYANVRFILDNIESGDATYSKNKALSNDANIYSYAKFVSEQNGVYKFTVDAVVFSGEKKTFNVTVDRVNETCVIE